MLPTLAWLEAWFQALATGILHTTGSGEWKLGLFQNAFSPTPTMVLADLDLCDFTGYAALEPEAGDCLESIDPTTGDIIVRIRPPLGGFLWETTGTGNLPQTVYGYYLADPTGAILLAAERFATPITLSGINQSVVVNDPKFRVLSGLVV